MKLEEILPEIRKGRKFRRQIDTESYIQLDKSCGQLCDFNNDGEWFDVTEFSERDILADDWELVPEKRKYSCWLGLFEDGDSISSETEARVYEYARLNAENMKPLKSSRLVEVRKIEWEVE